MSEGGQQHQHGGGHGHHGGGGGGEGFGFGGDGTQHNLLSHLLGLDHDAHDHGGHHMHDRVHGFDGVDTAPSHSVTWSSALQSMKLSDILSGLKVTPNMLYIMLYFGFAAWLFVIYWVRHNEPLANGVLGTAAAYSATAEDDRKILNGTKYAFPARTCEAMGDIYTPTPQPAPRPTPTVVLPMPAPQVPPMPQPEPQPMPLSFGQYGMLPGAGQYTAAFGQPERHAYMVPVRDDVGNRVKMIVNR